MAVPGPGRDTGGVHTARLILALPDRPTAEADHALPRLLGALHQNGQVLDSAPPVVADEQALHAYLSLPAADALDPEHHGPYVRAALAELAAAGHGAPRVRLLGADPHGEPECGCETPSAYLLYTTFVDRDSPLRCADCSGTVPLYRIPAGPGDLIRSRVLDWQQQYRACDRLWIESGALEAAALHELVAAGSDLSASGRELCAALAAAPHLGRPVYYYLHRPGGEEPAAPDACPSCGRPWRLDLPWGVCGHRCDGCGLAAA